MAEQALLRYTDYDQKLRALAQEIVTNIRDAPDVLRERGISEAEYARLAETSNFQTMLRQAAAEWGAVGNTKERVRLKSAILVEQALPEMFPALTDKNEPLSSRVSLLNSLAKIGDLGERSAAPAGKGNVFKLTLNLAGGSTEAKTITIESKALPEPELEFAPGPNDELTAGIEEVIEVSDV